MRGKIIKKIFLFVMLGIAAPASGGCGGTATEAPYNDISVTDYEAALLEESYFTDAERIAAVYRDIYEEAAEANTLGGLETMRRIVCRLGENGYVAIDDKNQVDMAGAEQVTAFGKAVDQKINAAVTIIVINDLGFRKFDLETENGSVNIVSGYYEYDRDGYLQKRNEVSYPADVWQYTQEGYLIFAGSYFSEEDYTLTMSDASEHTALRILPLDEACREANRKYILPVGYEQNNLFLADWSEEEFGKLDFYDLFDCFYPILYEKTNPYAANEGLGTESVYQIPEEVFENVVMTYFNIDRETLRSKTTYLPENAAYEYRPRGFNEAEYPDIPYPEAVSCTENPDGTVTLTVNAVYPHENTSKAYTHETVVRPLKEGGFQYVSNQVTAPEEGYDAWWHSDRLAVEEKEAECLLTEAEQVELKNNALTAAQRAKEVYKDIELIGESPYSSNIRDFTKEQRREVVALLGRAGYVSVTEDANMENYERVEDFYTAYMEKREAMVTVFNVNYDGLIGAVTFIYRNGEIQTYYVGIGWQEGGVPEIRDALVSDIAEIKLTEKGYFIYAYQNLIYHSSLRQYWRVKPLSDKCRELTAKYVYGLSYVNYNVLVTNWDSGNVEEVLTPCMFEDIYRIHTGENIKPQDGRIPAELYEKIMTTYFPVSTETLREKCGYDADSDSYEYDMIFARQYPPFGEVVDYTENDDGTLTLIVDAVWADYNSDLAFTNTIVVQSFEDGTFRYLSNSIEQKELEIPKLD